MIGRTSAGHIYTTDCLPSSTLSFFSCHRALGRAWARATARSSVLFLDATYPTTTTTVTTIILWLVNVRKRFLYCSYLCLEVRNSIFFLRHRGFHSKSVKLLKLWVEAREVKFTWVKLNEKSVKISRKESCCYCSCGGGRISNANCL